MKESATGAFSLPMRLRHLRDGYLVDRIYNIFSSIYKETNRPSLTKARLKPPVAD
ncbi:MAG: hypothetical protein LBT01_01715 [Spirochaetaceae bacterium]|nr:hypothetical protein [Spirochaetaceae bacterium]